MKRTSKTFIFFILSGYTIIMLFVIAIGINVYRGLKVENNLNDEFSKIEYIINNFGLNDTKIDMLLNNYISDGDYLEVEMALKAYLKDLLEGFRFLNTIYTDNELNDVIYLNNFDSDAPYFTTSKAIISDNYSKLSKIKTSLLELFTEEKIMSYIASYDLNWYYESYYKDMLLDYELIDNNKESISQNIDYSIAILDAYNNYFTFLSDNANYWTMDENYIYFENDELIETYNYLLEAITNMDFSNGVEDFI